MFEDNQNNDKVSDEEKPAVDLELLMKRLNDKDDFIETLKSERKADAERLQALEDRLKGVEFKEKIEEPEETQPQKTSLDSVENKVKELLDQRFKQQEQVTNLKSFEGFMVQQYGSPQEAKKAFEDKAQRLGYSIEQLEQMAATNTSLVRELFQRGPSQSKGAHPDQGSVQSNPNFNNENPAEALGKMKAELREKGDVLLRDPEWRKRYDTLYMAARSN